MHKFLILLLFLKSTFSADGNQIEFGNGTVEIDHNLSDINIGDYNSTRTNFTVRESLPHVLDFYNTKLLALNWKNVGPQLKESCRKDVETYIKGLGKVESWALRMEDSSGRYSTGWFWGNSYWIGSQTSCQHINSMKENYSSGQKGPLALKPSVLASVNKSSSFPTTNGPPYQVSFFMMRILVNSSFTNEQKILHIGLCLPFACSEDDVQKIMETTSASSKYVTVKVETVRSSHNRYNIWSDKTFVTLCVITIIVICLLTAGTCFDYFLEHLKKSEKKLKNCSHYNPALEVGIPDMKSKNGNCGLYVVNNNNNNINDSTTCNNSDEHLNSLEINNGNKNASRSRENIMRLILREMFLSFSIRANLKHICDRSVGSDTIQVIHGLKAISMAWVILGHTCIVAFKYSDNMEYRKIVQKEFMFQTISNGTFSVDTFFFTSGLLVSFLYFRSNAKGKLDPLNKGNGFVAGFLHFIGLISYRFARLTVPYLYTLGIVEICMKWFRYNSVFEPPTNDHENCPNYWWRNVLYINTLFPVDQMCMLWSWYLSDDTQFYVVGAIMLILATSHFKSAAGLLATFLLSSWITTGYVAYSNSHMPGSDDPLALFDKIYDKPWTRLGPYLIGMCTGWLLFKKNCKIRMSKLGLCTGWAAAFAILLSLVYGLYEARLSPWVGAAYSSLSHTAWALGLSWIVVACMTGYGGVVNKILSATILYPLSRVTYCAYLLHPIVIRGMVMSMDTPLHLGSVVTIIIFLGEFVASYALAFFVSLAFEAPVVSMLRIISKVIVVKKNKIEGS